MFLAIKVGCRCHKAANRIVHRWEEVAWRQSQTEKSRCTLHPCRVYSNHTIETYSLREGYLSNAELCFFCSTTWAKQAMSKKWRLKWKSALFNSINIKNKLLWHQNHDPLLTHIVICPPNDVVGVYLKLPGRLNFWTCCDYMKPP